MSLKLRHSPEPPVAHDGKRAGKKRAMQFVDISRPADLNHDALSARTDDAHRLSAALLCAMKQPATAPVGSRGRERISGPGRRPVRMELPTCATTSASNWPPGHLKKAWALNLSGVRAKSLTSQSAIPRSRRANVGFVKSPCRIAASNSGVFFSMLSVPRERPGSCLCNRQAARYLFQMFMVFAKR